MLSAEERRLDRKLWIGILLGPFAAGVNTIVGFTVAHWINDVGRKRAGFLVSAIDFALCIVAALIAASVYRQLPDADDTQPEVGRKSFMAKMGLILSVLSAMIVLAGTLALIILGPSD
jgi:hypothetical protein